MTGADSRPALAVVRQSNLESRLGSMLFPRHHFTCGELEIQRGEVTYPEHIAKPENPDFHVVPGSFYHRVKPHGSFLPRRSGGAVGERVEEQKRVRVCRVLPRPPTSPALLPDGTWGLSGFCPHFLIHLVEESPGGKLGFAFHLALWPWSQSLPLSGLYCLSFLW